MTDFMSFVDKGEFYELFEELGWDQVPRGVPTVTVSREGSPDVIAEPVASQSGLTVWVVRSSSLPSVSVQRTVDDKVKTYSSVRLLIFTDGTHQSWRWPRSGATAATNQKLLHHHYTVGDEERYDDLARRLAMIELEVGEKVGITEIQARMAKAFNDEAVRRSQQASGHMKRMNQTLLDAGADTDTASSLLVRLLFLFFGDDTNMWPSDTFARWILHQTTGENIHQKLTDLFEVLCDPDLDGCLVTPGETASGPYAGTEYENFRRIDGMYQERVVLPQLTEDFRQQVLNAGDFDWAKVNPDIFGAMFQQLVDPAQLREMGEHYTSEENIQKVIEPLFLDDLREKFDASFNDRAALLELQDGMASLQFLDPACGCGNFLIQAYKQLRGLEFEILTRARELELAELSDKISRHRDGEKVQGIRAAEKRFGELNNTSIQYGADDLQDSKLSMQQFFGIEINPWPAKVASTAMLLVDHLCNQVWGENVVRLPIEETPEIVCANALQTDWGTVIPESSKMIYIIGNPPFSGHKERTKRQGDDLKFAWGSNKVGHLNYVTGWFIKSAKFLAERNGEFALVSTSSITTGESVHLMFPTIFNLGWHISFAHTLFNWQNGERGEAAVHCVIIGFDRGEKSPLLVISEGRDAGVVRPDVITPYLTPGPPFVIVRPAGKPCSEELPPLRAGSTPIMGEDLIIKNPELESAKNDPVARKYLRRYMGGDELTGNKVRWCLWMDTEDFNPDDIKKSPFLIKRCNLVKDRRLGSSRKATQKAAISPHLFGEIRQPSTDYLAIPQTFTKNRRFATVDTLDKDTIASVKLFTVEDENGLLFSLLSSSMFIVWQKSVGGTFRGHPSVSSSLVWNTFPVPTLPETIRAEIIAAGQEIRRTRALHPDRSLAEAYAPDKMDPELLKAHDALDVVVDKAFGADHPLTTERERLEILFARYEEMTQSEK